MEGLGFGVQHERAGKMLSYRHSKALGVEQLVLGLAGENGVRR